MHKVGEGDGGWERGGRVERAAGAGGRRKEGGSGGGGSVERFVPSVN